MDLLHSPRWFLATTLAERIGSLRAGAREYACTDLDQDRGRRRAARWRGQPPFGDGALFARRLAGDGITQDQLERFLGEASETVRRRFRGNPAWLETLARSFSRPAPSRASIPLAESPGPGQFLELVRPLVDDARADLQREIRALASGIRCLPFDPETVDRVLFAPLPARLGNILGRTMALELQVARLQDLLQGETSSERFQTFVRRLADRDVALGILHEYPVLARQAVTCVELWVRASAELLGRLAADWTDIRRTFARDQDPGTLGAIEADVGDPHAGGRTVTILTWTSGLKLVYKPRPLGAGRHFQDLLRWLNRAGATPSFRTLDLLDRGTYGWAEFVPHRSCRSARGISRFYRRLGGYLAVLHALGATDCHGENLIADGEHPMLVDLETLLQPRVPDPGPSGIRAARTVMAASVLGIGLLPERDWGSARMAGLDSSGLGDRGGQLTPYAVPVWEGVGTDEIQLHRKRVVVPEEMNRPMLEGVMADPLDHVESIVGGFTRTYRLLSSHRRELLLPDGPLASFAADELRVVLRDTLTYDALLGESMHPDVLRDALDRDRLLDRLWLAAERCPPLQTVIPFERDDLLDGDIPLFTTRPETRDLWTSSGRRLPEFFPGTGMAAARQRVGQLGEGDMERQVWFIRASLATLAAREGAAAISKYALGPSRMALDRGAAEAGARAIGDRLEMLALRDGPDVSWVGLTLSPQDRWELAPLDTDLYDGLPGIALFLAYLGAATGEGRYAALARDAVGTLRRRYCEPGAVAGVGGYSGWGGIVYMLTHLSILWREREFLLEAEALADRLSPLIAGDADLDMIAGSAGCLCSLLGLYRHTRSAAVLEVSVRAGDHLLARAQIAGNGVGWIIPGVGPRPLAGLSHGSAGMARALLELAAVSGHRRFRELALKAISHERSLFDQAAGNWPDLRSTDGSGPEEPAGTPAHMTAWCHGAPGIGLARVCTLPYLDDAATRREIDAAVETTLRTGWGRNHSLCHGDLGSLELLLQASRALGRPARSRVDRWAASILRSAERTGWICGNPAGIESPGLMTGLAGIGYALLRIADPDRMPSVLTLEAPPCAQDSR